MRRHTLLIDADDTLWENNVFFEKAIEDFITLAEPCGYPRAYIRHILNETERRGLWDGPPDDDCYDGFPT